MRSGKKLVDTWSSNIGRTLKPGEALVEEIDVTKLYDLSQPGIYTISVTRHPEPWQHLGAGVFRSNTIAVTVVK